MLQITDLQEELKIVPVLRLGFRPFFLLGSIFSLFSVFIWVLMVRGQLTFTPFGGGYWWHIHEMIFGFCGAIIVGFLLTAVQNWTGIKGLKGTPLFLMVLLWFAGRLLMLFPGITAGIAPGQASLIFSALIDISFFPLVAIVLAKPIVAIKQYRNLFFIPLLGLFTVANIEMHLSLWLPQTFDMRHAGFAALMLVTLLICVMSARVVPMFTANGTKTAQVAGLKWLDIWANASLALATLLLLLHPVYPFDPSVFGAFLIIAGISQCIRWLRWRPWITGSVPLLWSLHGAITFIWLGLLLLGASYFSAEIESNHVLHLLTIGGIGGVILAMISRVSLGHTGRPLVPPKLMSLAFSLIFVSALLRGLAPWVWPQHTALFIDVSALCWLLGFALFIMKYGPMLSKARKDGRPG